MSGEDALSQPAARQSFLARGGEVGRMMREFDWTSTPLGSPETWPQSLRTALNILLRSKFPMFLAWGPELTFIYNDSYIEVLGGKHPAGLGAPFHRVWPEIWDDLLPLINRALDGEASYFENLPLTMQRKGFAEQTWFTFSYSPLQDDNGAVAGMFCACTETTDTVLAQQQRINEAERLRLLFDRAPSFIAVLTGPDHVIEMLNASYLQLVGHRDIAGKPIREALPEVEGQGFFELLDEVYQTGKPFIGRGVPIQLQRSPGAAPEERLVDFVYQPMIGPDGKVTGIFAEGSDVTERHQAELALRESEERFRLIADSAPVPMWVSKLDRSRGFVNLAYAQFLGVPYEEALDFDWRSRIHPEDFDRVVAESLAGEATLEPFALEARYRRHDGLWRWLRSESQPRWGSAGEHVGFIGVAHDITEAKEGEAKLRAVNDILESRVAERTADLESALLRLENEVAERLRAEEALRQAQKMEAVGQLTGGIAHDFNNLLTPIMGGLEIIAGRVTDERMKRIAGTALESARPGAKLTGQLLAFSRIQRISVEPVAVNDIITNMLDLLGHTIGKAVRIETRLDPDAGHGICDPNQLENAILNLAINARDAMPDGGVLTLSTGRIHVADETDLPGGDYVRLSIGDTGQGMPPEVIARATEPFFSTKPMGKGTGLGLAQVYGIARQSGGTVRFESEIGKGTIVHLLLVAASGAEPAREESSASLAAIPRPNSGRSARVLVIDDDDDVRAFLSDSLAGLGYSVEQAKDGEEGLRSVESSSPDIVLLDYAMPGMHGADVARSLRRSRPALPIVFVTGYAETEQLEGALGPDVAVLRKPFGAPQLAAAVEEQLAIARLDPQGS